MSKERLDVLLTERGLAPSREKARAEIMSGIVFVKGQRSDKPGTMIDTLSEIEVRGKALIYVSRGGLKLEKALDFFEVDVKDKIAIDAGASTGGFTDCLLQRGAAKVYAVDVGYGQLAWTLRNDPRVVCMERTNVRLLLPEQIGERLDMAVADVSFISLRLILPVLSRLLKDGADALCLIKPQFEVGQGKVGKKGVVREPELHLEVLEGFYKNAAESGFSVRGLTYSPVKGPEGNIEFLGHLINGTGNDFSIDLSALVAKAHDDLKGS